jgi:hypothetical protein
MNDCSAEAIADTTVIESLAGNLSQEMVDAGRIVEAISLCKRQKMSAMAIAAPIVAGVSCPRTATREGLLNRFVLLLMALSLGACAAPRSQTNNLQSGMSKAQVVSILGEPDSSRLRNGDDCLMYSLWRDFWNRTPGNYSDRYYACFTAGKLSSYGRVGDTF